MDDGGLSISGEYSFREIVHCFLAIILIEFTN